MCMRVSFRLTDKLKRRLEAKGYVYAYKMVKYSLGMLVSGSVAPGFRLTYWSGYTKAVGKKPRDKKRIGKGAIHVFLTRAGAESAMACNSREYVVVRVRCDAKDFVAAGKKVSHGVATFRGVTLTKRQHNLAIRQATNQPRRIDA